MPANVNNPRAADQLRREYDVLGDRLRLQLDDVVVPVAVIADLTAASGGIPTIRRANGTFPIPAVAAEFPVFRLEAPPRLICVVRRIQLVLPAAGLARVYFGSSIVAPASIEPHSRLQDGRLRAVGEVPAMRISYGTQAGGLAQYSTLLPGTTVLGITNELEWIFGRNDETWDFIEVQCPTVNNLINVSVEWDEVRV